MRFKRRLVGGIIASCFAVPFMPACGNDTFTSDSDAAASGDATNDVVPSESGADAGESVCSKAYLATVCADFDEPDPQTAFIYTAPSAFFTSTQVTDGGTLGIAPNGESLPNCLRSTMQSVGGLPDGGVGAMAITAGTTKPYPGSTHFKFLADIRFNAPSTLSDTVVLATFSLKDGLNGPQPSYQLIVTGGHAVLVVYYGNSTKGDIDFGPLPIAPSPWEHLAIDVQFGLGAPVTASFMSNAGSTFSWAERTDNQIEILLGLVGLQNAGTLDVSYDNVLAYALSDDGGTFDGGNFDGGTINIGDAAHD